MKIVKVVSDVSPKDLQFSKEVNLLKEYDLQKFIKSEVATPKYLSEVISLLTVANYLPIIGDKIPQLDPDTMLVKVIRETCEKLLADIRVSANRVGIEFISLEEARQKYPNTINLFMGTYTLHPCDYKRLARLEYYHKNLALEKDDELVVLVGRMGAKSLTVVENNNKNKSFSAQGNAAATVVEAKIGMSIAQDLSKEKQLTVLYQGNSVDIDPGLLINSTWYSTNGQVRAIFESRRFKENPMKKYILKNTYTESFDFDFDLAAKYLNINIDLKAEYNSISKQERYFEVEFGE